MQGQFRNNSDSGHAEVLLRARALCCVRNDQVLFRGLDLELCDGEILQVDGANGSGKTSLLRILCGLSLAEEGEVSWCGRDINSSRADYYRDLVYIAHTNAVKSDLTLLENMEINSALCGKRGELSHEEVLVKLALIDYADLPAGKLSSGQKRRLALTRLLTARARLWVLDEPLNSLDEASKSLITGLIGEHVDSGGSVVMTSHETVDLQSRKIRTLNL